MTGTADDADIYRYANGPFTRAWDATAAGLGTGPNVDGFARVDAGHFYVSFTADGLTLPNTGSPNLTGVHNEDVVYYDNGTWRMWFDGSANGLPTATNVVAFSVKGPTLYLSLSTTQRYLFLWLRYSVEPLTEDATTLVAVGSPLTVPSKNIHQVPAS